MPFSGGTYSAPSSTWNPAVAATTIDATDWAALLSDLSTALSMAVLKDGSQTITANLPMNSKKLTGLAAGTTAGDSLRYEQAIGVFLPLAGGTLTGNLLFTDATYDIGASGATRPRDLFLSRNAVIGGTLSLGGNVVSNLLFTDATYDIGASGATRPRDLFLSRNAVVGGTIGVTGAATLASVTGGVIANQAAVDAGTSAITVITPSVRKVSLLTTQTTGSGTSKDFVLVAGINNFTVSYIDVSTNGTSAPIIQLSVAGTPVTTGYGGGGISHGVASADNNTGFLLATASAAADLRSGVATFTRAEGSNTWSYTVQSYGKGGNVSSMFQGNIALAGAITGFRCTMVNETDAYDGGSIGGSYIL